MGAIGRAHTVDSMAFSDATSSSRGASRIASTSRRMPIIGAVITMFSDDEDGLGSLQVVGDPRYERRCAEAAHLCQREQLDMGEHRQMYVTADRVAIEAASHAVPTEKTIWQAVAPPSPQSCGARDPCRT